MHLIDIIASGQDPYLLQATEAATAYYETKFIICFWKIYCRGAIRFALVRLEGGNEDVDIRYVRSIKFGCTCTANFESVQKRAK